MCHQRTQPIIIATALAVMALGTIAGARAASEPMLSGFDPAHHRLFALKLAHSSHPATRRRHARREPYRMPANGGRTTPSAAASSLSLSGPALSDQLLACPDRKPTRRLPCCRHPSTTRPPVLCRTTGRATAPTIPPPTLDRTSSGTAVRQARCPGLAEGVPRGGGKTPKSRSRSALKNFSAGGHSLLPRREFNEHLISPCHRLAGQPQGFQR